MDFNKLAEARMRELEERPKAAMKRWSPYIRVVEEYMKGQGQELQAYQKANIAQCCDNLFDHAVMARKGQGISETTTSDAIAFI